MRKAPHNLNKMKYVLQGEETERLHFRLLVPEDFNDWKPLFETNEAVQFLGFDSSLSVLEMCEQWFEKAMHRYDNHLGGMNLLVDKQTGKMVGQCGLLVQTIENEERIEIGYSILPNYWNQGFASEAAQKCKNYAFENNLVESIISIVHIDNIASEKVSIKNGMTLEKRIENYRGMPVNIFRIDKSDWKK